MAASVKSKGRYTPCPDGGWGWVVVFGSFMIHVIADGVIYSFGLFYYEMVKHFGASKTITSMVVSIMNGTTYCIGPIASALTIKFGCRTVTIAGAIFSSLGFFFSTFANNIYTLYLTIGICAGFGFGLMYLPAIVIVTSYFEKKRAFATGIAVCGSGIGTAIMSPLIEYFISLIGWKGAMLIISGLLLNCALFGALFRPLVANQPEESMKENNLIASNLCNESVEFKLTLSDNEDEDKDTDTDQLRLSRLSLANQNQSNLNPAQSNKLTKSSVEVYINDAADTEVKPRSQSFSPGFLYRNDIFYSGSLVNIPNYKSNPELLYANNKQGKVKKSCFLFRWLNCSDEIMENFSEMIDLSLMKNYVFLVFSTSNFLTSVGYYIPYIYLKDWIVEMDIALPKETGWFTSIIGISSTVSRLVFGYLSDHSFVNRLWLYISSVTLCGLVIMTNTYATTFQLLTIFCALFGITCGTYVSLTSVVLVDLLGLEKLTNAFGLILLFQGVASIVGPLFIGFIYDFSGTYDTGFYTIGAIVAFSGLMLILIDLAPYFKSMNKLFIS